MGTDEINLLLALVIGGLTSLSLSNFFRKGGPWSKRSRLYAMVRLRTNRFLKRNGSSQIMQTDTDSVGSASLLFWVLILALIVTITIAVI